MTDANLSLLNTEFTFSLGGKDFKIRKANLAKGIQYQARVKELMDAKDAQSDLKLVAYCVFLALKDVDPTITEDWVMQNLPADVDPLEVLGTLGFISQKKVAIAKGVMDSLVKTTPTPSEETPA